MTTNKRKDREKLNIAGIAFKSPLSVRSNINTILDRILIATPDSPIAVFYNRQKGSSNLVAVFGSTILTRKLVAEDEFVGMFDRTMSFSKTAEKLRFASGGMY